jgi:hypothetical protein
MVGYREYKNVAVPSLNEREETTMLGVPLVADMASNSDVPPILADASAPSTGWIRL